MPLIPLGTLPRKKGRPPGGLSGNVFVINRDGTVSVFADVFTTPEDAVLSYARQLAGLFKGNFDPISNGVDVGVEATFCLPDFNMQQKHLHKRKFCYPGLRKAQFRETSSLVWWCTCSHEQEAQRNLFSGRDIPEQEFSEYLRAARPQCLHIMVLKVLASYKNMKLRDLLAHPPLRTQPLERSSQLSAVYEIARFTELCSCQRAVIVGKPSEKRSVVLLRNGVWRCTSCSNMRACVHVRTFLGPDGTRLNKAM